jgi:hypothetical protein
MTTQRWMVAVAVVAISIATVQLVDRWLSYRRIAAYHAELADTGWEARDPVAAALAKLGPEEVAYHAAMARKYRHAASYPWLPVEPDTPEPPGHRSRKR